MMLFVLKKKESKYVLWVSIADVDFYVKEKSSLDQEAFLRGNSTYFPDFVSPMLPEFLSQDFCSLKPDVSRLTMTAEIHLDLMGKVQQTKFYPSVIQSQSRFTYAKAQEILDRHFVPETFSIPSSIVHAGKVAQLLMNQRLKKGSLQLNISESEVHLNEKGYPVDIVPAKRLFSHQLIEELMLICNQEVAIFLNQQPSIYRVHEPPELKDIQNLMQFFNSMDSAKTISKKKLFGNERSLHTQINRLMEKIKDHPKQSVFHHLVLRALPQARYSAYNKGHFGLAFNKYTHFTSPIRRYSDLMVHRILKQKLGILKAVSVNRKELESKAKQISECEQRSVKAEREIENIKKARFMKSFLGEELKGSISSITRFGFFVTLKRYDVDGLVSVDSLSGKWVFDPVQLLLRGRFSKYVFRQGDEVLIQVISANEENGRIDFRLQKHLTKNL